MFQCPRYTRQPPRKSWGSGATACTAQPSRSSVRASPSDAPGKPHQDAGVSHSDAPKRIKQSGLRKHTIAGVKTATRYYQLPPPALAVRNLVEQSTSAQLCTTMSHMHHRRAGYPYTTAVDFSCDGAGSPLFCLSPLSVHSRNIAEDPRCSLELQLPGWSGLANARVTIFGDVYLLPGNMQSQARECFSGQQAHDACGAWMSSNYHFFRMHDILDIDFVGGFGTVQWIDVEEYRELQPDAIVMQYHDTLASLNATHAQRLKDILSAGDAPVAADDALFISVDATGADVRVRSGSQFRMERVSFEGAVQTTEEAVAAVDAVLRTAEGGD